MTEPQIKEKKSLAETLAALSGGDEQTPVDVAMKMLDPKDAVMHTELKNIPLMNKLKVMIAVTKDKEEKQFWQALYDINVLHPISRKGTGNRAEQMIRMFNSLTQFQLMQSTGVLQEKKGLFGGKR